MRLLLPIALCVLLLASCQENTLGPTVGSGSDLTAMVDGRAVDLPLSIFSSTYDTVSNLARFSGTLSGPPIETISITFNRDIDAGGLPVTLNGAAVTIVYTRISGADTLIYDCPVNQTNSCEVTLSATNREIVDGSFRATLLEKRDANKLVNITNGRFSVKLARVD